MESEDLVRQIRDHAHDLNNLLTAVIGNMYLLRDELPAGSTAREILGEAEKAGERSVEVNRTLLETARELAQRLSQG